MTMLMRSDWQIVHALYLHSHMRAHSYVDAQLPDEDKLKYFRISVDLFLIISGVSFCYSHCKSTENRQFYMWHCFTCFCVSQH